MAEIEPGLPVDAENVTIDHLISRALDEVARQDDGPLPYLTALHSKPTREVYDAAVQLLQSKDDEERELGARVLRELGPEDAGERPFSGEARSVLIKRLTTEKSPRVIGWIISALGYNNSTNELKTILRFAHHENAFVRFHVAAAIPSLVVGDSPDTAAIAAIDEMVTDHDADVRFYAAYALLEEIGGISQERRKEIANSLINDGDEQIRSFARSWIGEPREGLDHIQ